MQTNAAGDFFPNNRRDQGQRSERGRLLGLCLCQWRRCDLGYQPYVYAYRTDRGAAVSNFRDFFAERFVNKRGTYATENGLMHAFFMATAKEFGKDQYDMEAAFAALEGAMPMKISEFTFNMLSLLERGEVDIAVHIEGEALTLKKQGAPVDVWEWDSKPILTQTKTISRYADPMQKKLALALLNRTLSPDFLEPFGEEFLWRPTNSKSAMPSALAAEGVTNTADAVSAYWVPTGFLCREQAGHHGPVEPDLSVSDRQRPGAMTSPAIIQGRPDGLCRFQIHLQAFRQFGCRSRS